MKYWCDKCRDYVMPVQGNIVHPDLGLRTAFVCPKEYYPVYPREDRLKELV